MDEMTTAELNQHLENIAKLIETTAEDAASAAQIVRDSMASEEDTEELDEMTGKEIARLMEWLKAHGHTSDEIVSCIEYIGNDSDKLLD